MTDYKSMKLSEFVAEALAQIIEGVGEAQKKAIQWNGDRDRFSMTIVNPSHFASSKARDQTLIWGERYVSEIQFDVLVGTASAKSKDLSIGVLLATTLGAGAKERSSEDFQHTSRLRFKVPLLLPGQTATTNDQGD
ncbi:MAG: hypothetical protein ACF8XB_09785 [Planctomycetota bacterium JB042]